MLEGFNVGLICGNTLIDGCTMIVVIRHGRIHTSEWELITPRNLLQGLP